MKSTTKLRPCRQAHASTQNKTTPHLAARRISRLMRILTLILNGRGLNYKLIFSARRRRKRKRRSRTLGHRRLLRMSPSSLPRAWSRRRTGQMMKVGDQLIKPTLTMTVAVNPARARATKKTLTCKKSKKEGSRTE